MNHRLFAHLGTWRCLLLIYRLNLAHGHPHSPSKSHSCTSKLVATTSILTPSTLMSSHQLYGTSHKDYNAIIIHIPTTFKKLNANKEKAASSISLNINSLLLWGTLTAVHHHLQSATMQHAKGLP